MPYPENPCIGSFYESFQLVNSRVALADCFDLEPLLIPSPLSSIDELRRSEATFWLVPCFDVMASKGAPNYIFLS